MGANQTGVGNRINAMDSKDLGTCAYVFALRATPHTVAPHVAHRPSSPYTLPAQLALRYSLRLHQAGFGT